MLLQPGNVPCALAHQIRSLMGWPGGQGCGLLQPAPNGALWLTHACRWLSMRMESLGAFSTFLAAVVAVEQQGSNAAALGLLLTYALQVRAPPAPGACLHSWSGA